MSEVIPGVGAVEILDVVRLLCFDIMLIVVVLNRFQLR